MDSLQLTINRVRLEKEEAGIGVAFQQKSLDKSNHDLESKRAELKDLLNQEKVLPGLLKKEKDKLNSANISVITAETAVQTLNNAWIAQGKKLPKPKPLLDAVADLASRKRERDVLQKKVDQMEDQQKKIPDQKKKLNSEIKKLESDKPGIEGALNTAKTMLSALEEQYEQLNAEQMQQLEDALGAMPDAEFPVALFPVHLQTRFQLSEEQPELLIRIFPDSLHVDTHEPELTDTELTYGQHYWERIWRTGLKQDDTSEIQRQNAWAQLCQRFGQRRAAWLIRALTPLNTGDQPATAIAEDQPLPKPIRFPNPKSRANSWTRAPQARLLPDRWVACGYDNAGNRVLFAWSQTVQNGLNMGPDPKAPPPSNPSGDQLAVDAGMRWIFDFQEAENNGMAIRAPLSPEEAENGLSLLIVLGVKNSLDGSNSAIQLEQLIEAHHYTTGLAFVPPGLPSNNTEEVPSGYISDDPGYATSFKTECKTPLFSANDSCQAMVLAQAVGLNPAVFSHVQYAQGKEEQEARLMRTALWPVTWGYFLEQMMGADAINPEMIQQVRQHFIDFVSGGGPIPAIRAGKQPYGILPVTAINQWKPELTKGIPPHLISLLQSSSGSPSESTTLRQIWQSALSSVPTAGSQGASGQTLLDILGMEAISGKYIARSLSQQSNLGDRLEQARKLLTQLNISGDHRLLKGAFLQNVFTLDAPIAHAATGVEALDTNFIRWITTADVESLKKESGVSTDGKLPNTLLYLLLRHAMLLAYSNAAFRILMQEDPVKVKWENRLEPVQVDIEEVAEKTATLGRYLEAKVPRLDKTNQNRPLSKFIHTLKPTDHPAMREVDEMRASLQGLAGLPSTRLEDLFQETLDICSHRLDAWVTSLSTRRLSEMRSRKPAGVHSGGFGWVENLHPAKPPQQVVGTVIPGEEGQPVYAAAGNGGYIHAPSLDHAATAAILRSSYLTQNSQRDTSQFAVDLSSERARLAQHLLDGVRAGQTLSALLGYRFERGLHERSLDQFIAPFRLLAPLGPVYKLMAEIAETEQKIKDLEMWKSPELVAGEAAFEQFMKKKTQVFILFKQFYRNSKLGKTIDAIFKEIDAVTANINALAYRNLEGVPQKEKERLNKEVDRLSIIRLQWLNKLKNEIKALNDSALAFQKVHNELTNFVYRYPSNKTGKIKVKVNYDGPTALLNLEWTNPLIFKEDKYAVRAGLEKISDGQPTELMKRLPEALKEFQTYLFDLAGQSNPELAVAAKKLEDLNTILENTIQAYNKQYLFPPDAGIESMETIPAQNVVDGLALLRLWQDQGNNPNIPFGGFVGSKDIPLPKSGPQYDGLVAELNALADAVDAVGDAVTAESMYHLVKGNPLKAGATLDAIGRGELPPAELEFLKTPRGGTSLTHRVFMLLNERQPSVNWPTTSRQMRAIAEPLLNAWVGQLLGNPDKILIQAEYLHPDTKATLATREIRLSELKLSPLDFIYLSDREAIPLQSELEQRIAYHMLRTRPGEIPANAGIQLFFERGENWSSDQFCLVEMLEAGRTIRELVTNARPLHTRDINAPGTEAQTSLDTKELQQRTDLVLRSLETTLKALSKMLANPEKTNLESLREHLLAMAEFGLPGAIPYSAQGETPLDRQTLVSQGQSVLAEANHRWNAVLDLKKGLVTQDSEQVVAFCTNCLQALFNSDFQVMPLFLLAASGAAVQSLNQSVTLQDNDPFAVCAWAERLARVREGVGRLNDALLYAQALSQNYGNQFKVGQLPYETGDRWAALPFVSGQRAVPAGTISLVGYMPWTFDPGVRQAGLMIDEWAEVIPTQKQITGVAFQYDQPGARAPQAILLAVPPEGTEKWSMSMLESVILETGELLKLRAVDLEAVSHLNDGVAQFLPAVYLSLNLNGDTISTDPNRAFLSQKVE